MHHHPWQSTGGAAAGHHYVEHSAAVTAGTHHSSHAGVTQSSTVSSSDVPAIAADEVGAAFAYQYFKIMKTRPDDLFRFYNNDSRVSRGTRGPYGTIDARHATGSTRIREFLYKEHSCGTPLEVAIIDNIEAQDSGAGAVLTQITGTLNFIDDTKRSFVMSAFLVQQDNSSTSGYYVLNDILLFQQQDQRDGDNSVNHSQQLSNGKSQQRRVYKPNFNQPQQARLTQEPMDPVNPPVAPSAQPAAAPLPTTQAPQLSGATNTPTAASIPAATSEDTLITPDSPEGSKPAAVPENATGENSDEIIQHQVESGGMDIDSGNQDYVASLEQSVNAERKGEDEEVGKEEERESVSMQQDLHIHREKEEGNRDGPTREEENDHSAVTSESCVTIERAEVAVTVAPKEKKNVWKKPVSSVVVPEGFEDITVASTSASEKMRQSQSGKSPTETIPTSAMKPFFPVDPTRYSESSYAAKLLRSGPGGLRAPCQTGFAVPPTNEKMACKDEKRGDRKHPLQTYRSRPGRGKTLWVSSIPSDMTDEKVCQAVSNQLRGQSCEGHVIRIERIPGQQHGYIELDTEICAKLLLEKGLHLQGREVTIDFPNRNHQGRRPLASKNDEKQRTADEAGRFQQHRSLNQDHRRDATTMNGHVHDANVNNSTSNQSYQDNEEGWTSASRRKHQQHLSSQTTQHKFQQGSLYHRRQHNGNSDNMKNPNNQKGQRSQGGRQQHVG